MNRILNFGSLNIDLVYSLDHIVREGETISSKKREVFPGGKGTNQSIALARAGGQVFHAGNVGEDGIFLRDLLEENQVDCRFLSVRQEPNGHAVILKDKEGQNSIVLFGGSNQSVEETQVEEAIRFFEAGDVLVCQNEINCMPKILERAAAQGMRIALNPSPFTEDIRQWPLSSVTWLFINEIEGEQLTGVREEEKMLEVLKERYPDTGVILTLGSQGAIYQKGEERVVQPAVKTHVADTTAAGDTFMGYFISTYLLREDPKAAMESAAAAASLAVSRDGAVPSIPRKGEVEELLAGLR